MRCRYWLLLLTLLFSTAQADDKTLTILNWSEYMDPDVLNDFSEHYNVTINQLYFESDDNRDRILTRTKGRGYDLVMVDEKSIDNYHNFGWLAPITEEEVPNLRNVDKKWLRLRTYTNGYTSPFLWGTTGIAYNSEIIPEGVDSWRTLFAPPKEIQGKIVMVKNSQEVIGMALKCLGYSANSQDRQHFLEVEKLLLQQKPHVKGYSYTLDENSALLSGEVAIAMMYSGDAMMLRDISEHIKYVVPKEGGGIWMDYFVVLSSSNNKDMAYQFLNYINQPKVAARIAQYGYGPTPNLTALKHLPVEFINNPDIYPNEESLRNSEWYQTPDLRTARRINEIFYKVVK